MHTPPQDATATDTAESSTPAADAADATDAPEHRTGPQEAQPYSPPHPDVEPESDHAFSGTASGIEPPPAAAEPAIAAITTTTKDGQ
jgi:hypothetical protein